ncbi:MAG: hypothetical protein IKG46_13300 [Solobacterium sp.]|nr:hypothetical protein [Solobacterium sp.]
MNSLEMYKYLLKNSWDDHPRIRAMNADRLIRCIVEELYVPPYLLKNSPFLTAAAQEQICAFDALFMVIGTEKRLQDSSFTTLENRNVIYLFRDMRMHSDGKYRSDTRRILRRIKLLLPKEPEESAKDESEPVSVSVYEKERLRHLAERSQNNQEISDAWHLQQRELVDTVNGLEPTVRAVTTALTDLRDRIQGYTDTRFIEILIRQYHQIADAWDYHFEKARNSDNEDYYNAVLNYSDFMYDIIDYLALFGVEEIRSEPGTPFDGSIHTVRGTKEFSPRETVVRRSLRSGFRRGDTVLEKERILTEVTRYENRN